MLFFLWTSVLLEAVDAAGPFHATPPPLPPPSRPSYSTKVNVRGVRKVSAPVQARLRDTHEMVSLSRRQLLPEH
jgi:hypothetical protein